MLRNPSHHLLISLIFVLVFFFAKASKASISVLDDELALSGSGSTVEAPAFSALLADVEAMDTRPEVIALLISESAHLTESSGRKVSEGRVSQERDPEAISGDRASIADLALSALLDEIEESEAISEEIDDTTLALDEAIDLDEMVMIGPDPETSLLETPFLSPPNSGLPDASSQNGMTYDVPIISNTLVEKYITLFQTQLRPHFEKWLVRSGHYIDMMRKILREHDLPEDLVYLALIESGFNPKAFSKARAAGPWQFIQGTGKKYGLRIDQWIDERRDPVKATHAAARYLKDLYEMFGSWPLAMASYNGGEGRVSRAVRGANTEDFWELRKTNFLRRETKNYIPKFMAATIIAKDPTRHLFSVEYQDPWAFEEVEIEKATYLSSIAKYAGITLNEVRLYNPELKRDVTPPRAPGYRIKLPVGKKETFLASYSPEHEEDLVLGHAFKHRVRRGDSISSIARRYGVSVDLLLETNRLNHSSIIHAGQYVLVSEGWSDGDKHRIQQGDTLSTIAVRYNVSMRHLLEVNQLHKRSVIRAGDTLIIPIAAERTKHKIRRGETISTIARKYAVRKTDLLRVNSLEKEHFIREGSTLIIP